MPLNTNRTLFGAVTLYFAMGWLEVDRFLDNPDMFFGKRVHSKSARRLKSAIQRFLKENGFLVQIGNRSYVGRTAKQDAEP
ncbi:MAG: hypothetical protein ABJ226_17860 [Roseobacter sp.]